MAIVLYAPPIHARQLRCEAAIESIRSQGRWAGRIYLITEQVKCYQVRDHQVRSSHGQAAHAFLGTYCIEQNHFDCIVPCYPSKATFWGLRFDVNQAVDASQYFVLA